MSGPATRLPNPIRPAFDTVSRRFESWLFRVTMNRVRDEVRRVRRQPFVSDPGEALAREPERRSAGGSGGDQTGAELPALRAAMEALNESDREVVELRHHAGLSFKQMSDLLDEPVGTLLARHHRALRKLREIIESSASDPRQPGEPVRRPSPAVDDGAL